jgi:hypothetical protein
MPASEVNGRPANLPSGLAENAFNLANGNPVDLRHLGNRHAVFYQGADAGELRPWNLTPAARVRPKFRPHRDMRATERLFAALSACAPIGRLAGYLELVSR